MILKSTGTHAIGYDQNTGKIVRKPIYEDDDGTQYVIIGRKSIPNDSYCETILGNGALEKHVIADYDS